MGDENHGFRRGENDVDERGSMLVGHVEAVQAKELDVAKRSGKKRRSDGRADDEASGNRIVDFVERAAARDEENLGLV